MHFNRKQLYLGLFDGETEERVAIDSVDAIYDHAERLQTTAARYSSE
ncbi:hypothetical protein AB9F29_20925 [Falsihalocynthiibacter sp. S25ZX9]